MVDHLFNQSLSNLSSDDSVEILIQTNAADSLPSHFKPQFESHFLNV